MRLKSLSFATLGLVLVLGTGQVRAQEFSTSHIAAARDLVIAVGASTSIDRIMPTLVAEIRKQILTRPEMTKDLDEVLTALAPEIEQQKQQAVFVAARSYAKYMTEAEIKDTLVFFRSSTGQKYAKVQPLVTEDLVNTVTAWSQLAADYVQTRVRAEMLKRGHQMQ